MVLLWTPLFDSPGWKVRLIEDRTLDVLIITRYQTRIRSPPSTPTSHSFVSVSVREEIFPPTILLGYT